jgi:hypothetical protein
MAEKLLEVEHDGDEIILRIRKPDAHLPEETRSHINIIQKETLLTIRDILNKAIERIEDREKTKSSKKKKTKIEVQ